MHLQICALSFLIKSGFFFLFVYARRRMSDNNDTTLLVGMSSSFFMVIVTGLILWYILDEDAFRQFFKRFKKKSYTTTAMPTTSGPTTTGTAGPTTTGTAGHTTTAQVVRNWKCIPTKDDYGRCRWIKVRRTADNVVQCAGNDDCDWANSEAECKRTVEQTGITCPDRGVPPTWCTVAANKWDRGSNTECE